MPDLKSTVAAVKDRESLCDLLRELGWPVDPDEPFTFEPEIAAGIRGDDSVSLSRLIPASTEEKNLILLAEFERPYLREDLRDLLSSVRRNIRTTGRFADHTGFGDTIFIVASPRYEDVRLVLFEEQESRLPRIRIFGWDEKLIGRTLIQVNLPRLHWQYRKNWQEAWSTQAATNEFFSTYEAFFNKWRPQIQVKVADSRKLKPDELTEIQTHLMQRAMNRLFFLTFLSKKGWLELDDDRDNYLQRLYAKWKENSKGERFYESRLGQLFFEALAKEDDRIRELLKPVLGTVPYLNGGLFERKHFDLSDPSQDHAIMPDGMFDDLLRPDGLLAAYNFTVVESYDETDQDIAVDPEMLGRIFEKLVLDRRDEGKYYTPRQVVRFMCRESLKKVLGGDFALIVDAPNLKAKEEEAGKLPKASLRPALAKLKNIKVLDPACGSGAYLLGMLHELFDLVMAIELRLEERTESERYQLKLEIIERNIYGVDLDEFATNIAMLRLWLALVVDRNENPIDSPGIDVSLPNLRFKICNGDSLSAPDPHRSLFAGDEYIADARRLRELHDEYFLPDARRARPKSETEKYINECEERLATNFQGESLPENALDWRVKFAEVFAPEGPHQPFRGFDIVLANPPYGVKVEDTVRFAYFDRKSEGAQSKDSYGMFMARALQLLRAGGTMCYIVSDTWRTIKSHLPLRKRLISNTTVQHFIDLPGWIFDATVNTGILTLVNEPPTESHQLIAADLRPLRNGDWKALELNLSAIANHGPDLQTLTFARYTYPQSLIGSYSNHSFFIASPLLYPLMSDPTFQKLGEIADIKVGLQTGDNEYYLRKREGVRGSYRILDESLLLSDQEIANLSEEEKKNGVEPARYGGRHFVPYDKGGESDAGEGWLPNYWVPTSYFIDWSRKAVERLRTATIADVKRRRCEINKIKPSDEYTRAAVIRNTQHYFQYGVTFSPTGIYSPTVRLGCNAVFGNKGSTIFSDLNPPALMAWIASVAGRYLLKSYCSHSIETGEEALGQLILDSNNDELTAILDGLVTSIIDNQRRDPSYSYHKREQREIDALIFRSYELGKNDIREVVLWYCRRYATLAEAQGILSEAQEKYGEYLSWCDFILSKPSDYWSSHPLLQLIAQGEGLRVEFKETFEADGETGQKKPELIHSSLKNIAAFLNTEGGSLLIGVHDKGQIVGLLKDFAFQSKEDKWDAFQLHLKNHLARCLDPDPLGKYVKLRRETLLEGDVCIIEVSPRSDITYLKSKKDGRDVHDIYVRDGNRAIALEGKRRDDWIRDRGL